MLSKEYIAGFFDGEGHLGITITGKAKQCQLRLTFVNTNYEILEMINFQYGGYITLSGTSRPWAASYRSDWKTSYQLKLRPLEIVRFVNDMKDLVIVKAPQIKLALEFIEYMNSKDRFENVPKAVGAFRKRTEESIAKELEFKDRMHVLNRTGAA